MHWRRSSLIYNRINQTITGFFEIGFKLTVNIGDSVDSSIFRYKETSLWESGPLPILALLLSRFVVVVLFIDSMLLADTITSGDFLLLVTNSFSLTVVCVDREMHVVSDSPFFRSLNSIS